MGGIVGGDTVLLLASEEPLPPPSSLRESSTADGKRAGKPPSVEPTMFMFPHVQGVMAFDTPFLGIAPGVVSYGAEGHYKTVATAYNTISEVASVFGFGGNKASETTTTSTTVKEQEALPSAAADTASADAAATPSWQRWGRYAMFAGAAGAVAAGGAAALYSQRDNLTAGWSWVTSHLEFVGCLARPEDLRRRVASLSNLYAERRIGCANFYTCLGKGAQSIPDPSQQGKTSFSQKIIRSKDRTFCSLPPDIDQQNRKEPSLLWIKATNDKSSDETTAHISMFSRKDNPAFNILAHQAAQLITEWVDKGWYASATKERRKEKVARDESMDGDDLVVVD